MQWLNIVKLGIHFTGRPPEAWRLEPEALLYPLSRLPVSKQPVSCLQVPASYGLHSTGYIRDFMRSVNKSRRPLTGSRLTPGK